MAGGLSGPSSSSSATSGTWTPTFTNLTVVGATSHTGTWVKLSPKIVFFQITIAAATSVATTTSTYCDNFPFSGAVGFTPCSLCSDDSTKTAIGLGGGNTNVIFLGAIAATSKIHVTGFVLI